MSCLPHWHFPKTLKKKITLEAKVKIKKFKKTQKTIYFLGCTRS